MHFQGATLQSGRAETGNLPGPIDRELDVWREGCNARRFGDTGRDEPTVRVPRDFWERSRRRVLTMKRRWGLRVSGECPQDPTGRHRLGIVSARPLLPQLPEFGLLATTLIRTASSPWTTGVIVLDPGVLGQQSLREGRVVFAWELFVGHRHSRH